MLTRNELFSEIKKLLQKYNAEYGILFGSYARGEATETSDIDIIVVGGEKFQPRDIFAFGEELRQATNKNVDAFEIREVNPDTVFYDTVMKEGVRIA